MLYQSFDMNAASLDMFGVHHCAEQGFVRFVTGEMIYCNSSPDPDHRHNYSKWGVELAFTADEACPKLYLDEDPASKPIPKAWLTQKGGQYLAIDHERGVAVRLARSTQGYRSNARANLEMDSRVMPNEREERIPAYIAHRASVYWAGPKRRPVGDPIHVSEPFVPNREQRAHLNQLRAAADAWAALLDLPQFTTKVEVNGEAVVVPAFAEPITKYLNVGFKDLSTAEKLGLWRNSFAAARVLTKHQYLYVRKD